MSVDLRALAERLGVLKTCDGCGGNGDFDGKACPACGDRGWRLPTEAEVRAAIFAAGRDWIETGSARTFAYVMFGGDDEYRVEADINAADPDDLVLLVLLRALEACRG